MPSFAVLLLRQPDDASPPLFTPQYAHKAQTQAEREHANLLRRTAEENLQMVRVVFAGKGLFSSEYRGCHSHTLPLRRSLSSMPQLEEERQRRHEQQQEELRRDYEDIMHQVKVSLETERPEAAFGNGKR